MQASLLITTALQDADATAETVWRQPGVLGIEELPQADALFYGVPQKFHVVEFGTETARELADWIQRDGYRTGDRLVLKVYLSLPDVAALDQWTATWQREHPETTIDGARQEEEADYTLMVRDQRTGQAVGQRLWVGPPWIEPMRGRLAIVIEPGMAFGSGDHVTTQLALEALERLQRDGFQPGRLLDVGTGSGVLAIAAAKLMPEADIWCTDLDPQCASNFWHNWQRNGLEGRPIKTVLGDHAPLEKWDNPLTRFDLVISNIFLGPLVTLIPAVSMRLAPAGRWLVTGLLGEIQRDEFVLAAREAGLTCVRTQEKACDGHDLSGQSDVWHLVEMQRN